MTIETQQIPVISTAHLTREVAEVLDEQGYKNPWCVCAAWKFGYFLYLDELGEDAPQSLRAIHGWLTKHGFTDRWVCLDPDAPEVETLPTYEW